MGGDINQFERSGKSLPWRDWIGCLQSGKHEGKGRSRSGVIVICGGSLADDNQVIQYTIFLTFIISSEGRRICPTRWLF